MSRMRTTMKAVVVLCAFMLAVLGSLLLYLNSDGSLQASAAGPDPPAAHGRPDPRTHQGTVPHPHKNPNDDDHKQQPPHQQQQEEEAVETVPDSVPPPAPSMAADEKKGEGAGDGNCSRAASVVASDPSPSLDHSKSLDRCTTGTPEKFFVIWTGTKELPGVEAVCLDTLACLHPNAKVYLLSNTVEPESLKKLPSIAASPNFSMMKFDLDELARQIGLKWLPSEYLKNQHDEKNKRVNGADMLRYMMLYIHRGVYLDSDILPLRPLAGWDVSSLMVYPQYGSQCNPQMFPVPTDRACATNNVTAFGCLCNCAISAGPKPGLKWLRTLLDSIPSEISRTPSTIGNEAYTSFGAPLILKLAAKDPNFFSEVQRYENSIPGMCNGNAKRSTPAEAFQNCLTAHFFLFGNIEGWPMRPGTFEYNLARFVRDHYSCPKMDILA